MKLKRILIYNLMLLLILIFVITGCSSQGDIVEIPKGYNYKEEYYDENGFQDYTDYAKYIYPSQSVIINNDNYKKITKEDIEDIKGYFNDFRNWMSSRLDEYDFDDSMINEGDYVRIRTKEGEKIGNSQYNKYDNYSIYFFDIETLTLYYIHNNI